MSARGGFGNEIVLGLPAALLHRIGHLAIVHNTIFLGAENLSGGGSGEEVVATVAIFVCSTTFIHGSTDNNLFGFDVLIQ